MTSPLFSLGAVLTWGTSDFVGGYAARRANAFYFTALAHFSGLALMLGAALVTHADFPSRHGLLWSLAAGSTGGVSLAIFYRALASGKMGLTAPVAALLGAGIPTVVTILREGMPGRLRLLGFVLAAVGIWLISRPEGDAGHPEGLGMAALAGVGFAGFYLCVRQAGDASSLWIAATSRTASFVVTLLFALLGRHPRDLTPPTAAMAVLAGCLDISGSALFIRASQAGRLDVAVVLSSLYPAITVVLARALLGERFSHLRTIGLVAALAAVPLVS
jgi:drug/metabolite transporter (DMT)-like permease